MKKTLLFALLMLTQFMSAQYYISELVVSPPNNSAVFNDYTDTALVQDFEYPLDNTIEYIELRGTPNATIPADVYFIAVDGDDEQNAGKIQDAVDLSGLTFGNNGILVLVSNMTFANDSFDSDGTTDISGVKMTNPYATALQSSGASVETFEFTGTPVWVDEGNGKFELDKFSGVTSIRGYDGNIVDQSATYMIVKTSSGEGSPRGKDIDADNDGAIDGDAANWTIYDGVSVLDDDDTKEYAYSEMIFIEDPDVEMPLPVTLVHDAALSPTVILLNQYPQYVARQGLKTGNSVTKDEVHNDDWMAGRVNSRSWPDWKFSGTATRSFPSAELAGKTLSSFNGLTLGEVNIDFANNTASINDVFASKTNIFPNPASNFVKISSNLSIDKVEVYNVLGKKVLNTTKFSGNLDITNLSKGLYLLKLTSGNLKTTKKLIVK